MKMQSTSLFAHLSKTMVKNLTAQVKETLAIGFNMSSGKTFSTADLWNIQRQRKSLVTRRGSL
jgi:hypothetical protein